MQLMLYLKSYCVAKVTGKKEAVKSLDLGGLTL